MCGIIYIMRKDGRPAYKTVLKRYRKQKHRGTEGYGYVAIKDNVVVSYKRAPTEHEIIEMLEKEDAPEILFHHRNPTSTVNIEEEAQPLLIQNKLLEHGYYVAHNGVIRNDISLKKKHNEMGIEYGTEISKGFKVRSSGNYYRDTQKLTEWNDSEAIAVETALAIDGKKESIETEGYAAIIGLQVKDGLVVSRFFYRNLNPLTFHEDKQIISIASMGHGNVVKPDFVLKLGERGGFQQIRDLKTPPTFKPTPPQDTTPWHNRNPSGRVWNSEKMQWDDLPSEKNRLHLPAAPRMGFVPPAGNSHITGDRNMRIHWEDDEMMFRFDDEEEPDELSSSIKSVERIIDLAKGMSGLIPVTSYTLDLLYSEWTRADDAVTAMEKAIKILSERTETMAVIPDELYSCEERLENAMQRARTYAENLSKQLQVSELNGERMRV